MAARTSSAKLTVRSSTICPGAASQTSTLSRIAAIQRAGIARMISPGGGLSNPAQVGVAAIENRQDDELGHFVVVQLEQTRLERGHAGLRGLHDELPFLLGLHL